ncbi:hypothetical protein GA0074696_5024 [Micromonospora purpureochromogenes]|uniref:Lipoprotein n=1 Tax=Micromonospora purpureochromogenes TaxID=47872 RepID=A0A1C4ZXS4_9ACTN|nr:hypothetical protein [Micromonospora purpureochromogenes]SCF37554.1 hypothetical protein GA0074696_5024 [Micromonospora purpureochromogenes]
MASVRRRGTTATALLTLVLAATACGPVADRGARELRVGYDSLDGTLPVWPPRGSLAGDAAATRAVTEAVRAWRSPIDDRAHLPSSGILFSGEVDGTRLALVAADVPGEGASWLLQLTGDGGRYTVTRASEYSDPGYLAYADVLPVQLADGRRYLASGRVERLLGPDGRALVLSDGLSRRVRVPACAAVPVTATLRATESLPRGRAAERLLDLGTATAEPRYPLVRDETGSGRRALDGLDTCVLADERGPFGSVPRRIGDRDAPRSAPESWPMEKVSVRAIGEMALGGGDPGDLEQLTWETDAGTMTAVVYRPADGGTPVVSPADRSNPLQTYVLPVPGQPLVVLTWRGTRDASLSVPPGTPRLVDRPGLTVVPMPAARQTFSLAGAEKTYYRSVGGR